MPSCEVTAVNPRFVAHAASLEATETRCVLRETGVVHHVLRQLPTNAFGSSFYVRVEAVAGHGLDVGPNGQWVSQPFAVKKVQFRLFGDDADDNADAPIPTPVRYEPAARVSPGSVAELRIEVVAVSPNNISVANVDTPMTLQFNVEN